MKWTYRLAQYSALLGVAFVPVVAQTQTPTQQPVSEGNVA